MTVKFALVSHVLPPSWSGQAVMIGRLLNGVNGQDYCLICTRFQSNGTSDLQGNFYSLPPGPVLKGGKRFISILWLENLVRVFWKSWKIAFILRKEQCDAAVACSGDLSDIPATAQACHWLRIPYFLYYFDDYVFQWPNLSWQRLAAAFENRLVPGCAGVIVPNEFMEREIKRRFPEVKVALVRNPCLDITSSSKLTTWTNKDEIRIVYTGAVYGVNKTALRRLAEVINEIEDYKLSFHIYTAQAQQDLEEAGVWGNHIIYHQYVSTSEAATAQEGAHLLFLPFSFDSHVPQVIQTAAPGKMGEYLASGVPILVHAPADSFVSWYFQKNECGMVVDCPEAKELALSVHKLIEDSQLREKIVTNALHCAKRDFSLDKNRGCFLQALGNEEK